MTEFFELIETLGKQGFSETMNVDRPLLSRSFKGGNLLVVVDNVSLLVHIYLPNITQWITAPLVAWEGLIEKANYMASGDSRVIDELKAGNHIQAIKVYREITHTSLREAKDYVDALKDKLEAEGTIVKKQSW